MGFTKTHLVGVFLTESALALLGIGFAVFSFFSTDESSASQYLLVAICLFLLQLGVLLSSILSLLFYAGSSIDALVRSIDEAEAERGAE